MEEVGRRIVAEAGYHDPLTIMDARYPCNQAYAMTFPRGKQRRHTRRRPLSAPKVPSAVKLTVAEPRRLRLVARQGQARRARETGSRELTERHYRTNPALFGLSPATQPEFDHDKTGATRADISSPSATVSTEIAGRKSLGQADRGDVGRGTARKWCPSSSSARFNQIERKPNLMEGRLYTQAIRGLQTRSLLRGRERQAGPLVAECAGRHRRRAGSGVLLRRPSAGDCNYCWHCCLCPLAWGGSGS